MLLPSTYYMKLPLPVQRIQCSSAGGKIFGRSWHMLCTSCGLAPRGLPACCHTLCQDSAFSDQDFQSTGNKSESLPILLLHRFYTRHSGACVMDKIQWVPLKSTANLQGPSIPPVLPNPGGDMNKKKKIIIQLAAFHHRISAVNNLPETSLLPSPLTLL